LAHIIGQLHFSPIPDIALQSNSDYKESQFFLYAYLSSTISGLKLGG